MGALLDYSDKAEVFHFRYGKVDAAQIHGVRRIPTKDGGTAWVFPNRYPTSLLALRGFKNIIKGTATDRAIKEIEKIKKIEGMIEDGTTINSLNLDLSRAPYPHQLRLAEAMLHCPSYGILAEQGLGKTFVTMLYIMARNAQLGISQKSLVVAPQIVLRNWVREVEDHSPLKPFLYYGSAEKRLSLQEKIQDQEWDMIVTNYETLVPTSQSYTKVGLLAWWADMEECRRRELLEGWARRGYITENEVGLYKPKTRKVKGEVVVLKKYWDEAYKAMKKVPHQELFNYELMKKQRSLDDLRFLKDFDFDNIILDEGSRIKGHNSRRTNAVLSLGANIDRRYILSGTLCLGDPRDVHMPMSFLGEHIFSRDRKKFERKYVTFSPYNKHIVTGYKNLDDLKEKMDPYIMSMRREDCVSLPDRIFDTRYYELTEQQQRIYEILRDEEEYEVASERVVDASLPAVRINKLMQVLSGFLILPHDRNDQKCNDCDMLVKCVENDVYPWDKSCVMQDLENPVAKPKREYETFPTSKLDMLHEDLTTSDEKTIIWAYYKKDLENIESYLEQNKIPYITPSTPNCDHIFENSDEMKVFLGQVSQGIGITLNSATRTIYYSHGPGLEARLQSLDRNHRIGQRKNVLVIDYVSSGTVEESILFLLKHKEDVKEFMQKKPDCPLCRYIKTCFKAGIEPYSEECVLYDSMKKAELKAKVKV